MKSRPMIFSSPMVRAILAGQKTQTRRVVKVQPPENTVGCVQVWKGENHWDFWGFNGAEIKRVKCPYGVVGDRLWVRETYLPTADEGQFIYNADQCADWLQEFAEMDCGGWKSPIFMPRAASRIELEITDIRIERLRSISRGDCMAEGCPFPNMQANDPIGWYADLWESINGEKHPWSDNPWVWVVQFERVEVAA